MSYKTYSHPVVVPYSFGNLNFVTGAATYKIKPPRGMGRGYVEDIHVRVTTLFTQVTTPAFVRVGTTASNSLYAELNMGAAAAGAAYNARDIANVVRGDINLSRDAVTDIDVRVVAPTGGTPAGVGFLDVILGWYV
jgi:hypothetical protein